MNVGRYHYLGYSVAVVYASVLARMVVQSNNYLSAVVAVYHAHFVGGGKSLLGAQTAARVYQPHTAFGYLHGYARMYEYGGFGRDEYLVFICEAEKIRRQARAEADALLAETNRKAEAIDQLAREQAISQARKMVQAATDEAREIQNAHRLRLQDLKSRIAAMEQQRNKLMDFFSQMIGELQEAQDYARQNTPVVDAEYDEDVTEVSPEPRLDLSDKTVEAAAAALPVSEETAEEAPQKDEAVNCVVAPGLDEEEPAPPRTVELVPEEETTPSAEYFDTEPKQQPSDPPEIEVPGAIFSYPILRQEGEPILDEEPPARGPHQPVMPDLSDTGEDDEDADSGDIQLIPERKPEENPRRQKAVAALRGLRRKMART